MITLSGIVVIGVIFVLMASLIVFACIRSQRLRQSHSLAPKKLDLNDGSRLGTVGSANECNGSVGNGTGCDDLETKMKSLNSLEKNLLMKNTIMKMTNSNQVLATVANGTEGVVPSYVVNGALPVYSEYEYNYAYPTNRDLVIANGNVLNHHHNNNINKNSLPSYGYDNISAYNGHFDYTMHDSLIPEDKVCIDVHLIIY